MIRVCAPSPGKYKPYKVRLPASKSITNRLLLLQKAAGLRPRKPPNQSPVDVIELYDALSAIGKKKKINTGEGGTTFRFMLALLAATPGTHVLDCAPAMRKRPVKPLVNTLNKMGARIEYIDKQGQPPLRITGAALRNQAIIDGSVSSQFISALMLIAPRFKNTLEIKITGRGSSRPYIAMTAGVLKKWNIRVANGKKRITVDAARLSKPAKDVNEPDWSAAAFWYEWFALSDAESCLLTSLRLKNSLQGDAGVAKIFTGFGIKTLETSRGILLKRSGGRQLIRHFRYDFTDCPDMVPAIAATCAGLGIRATMTGISTLKHKESDRIQSLSTELKKFGVKTLAKADSFEIFPTASLKSPRTTIKSHGDHRIAMCMAPLALKTGEIVIDDETVVAKSYPQFWDHLRAAGFRLTLQSS